MPPAETNSLETTRKVTDRLATFSALSIDVCKSADSVAIYFGTTKGTVLVTAKLRDFIRKCRAECDHNGNRFPTAAELKDENRSSMRVLEEDAAASTPESASVPEKHQPATKPVRYSRAELDERCTAAWYYWKANREVSIRAACDVNGISDSLMHSWLHSSPAILSEYNRLKQGRRWKRRMNHTEAAAAGLPLCKPNGGI